MQVGREGTIALTNYYFFGWLFKFSRGYLEKISSS